MRRTGPTPASGGARSHPPALRSLLLLAALVASLAIVGVARPASASAQTLAPRFAIDRQAAYTREPTVVAGDDGWSPFFEPGVLVWHGGSILGGVNGPEASSPPARTVALLPYVVRDYRSITMGPLVATMLRDAPLKIDPLYEQDADADVCIVMAGANDLVLGHGIDDVVNDLRQYCEGRRAAGFKVVVVTLLPRTIPADFEPARLAFNELVRAGWMGFADGLADVGADTRIGASLANLDRHYYTADAVHPNKAGYAVMAGIIAPVVQGLSWKSDACELRLRNADGVWTGWHHYVARSTWLLEEGDGVKSVEAEYRDDQDTTVAASDSIILDTTGPRTTALAAVMVRRGAAASLRYLVTDPAPGSSPSAKVTIAILRRDGSVVKRLFLGRHSTGSRHVARFACWLAKGRYTYTVHAKDAAGNPETRAGSARLTVG